MKPGRTVSRVQECLGIDPDKLSFFRGPPPAGLTHFNFQAMVNPYPWNGIYGMGFFLGPATAIDLEVLHEAR